MSSGNPPPLAASALASAVTRRWRASLAVVFLLSLSTRLLMLAVVGPVLESDSAGYLSRAESLVASGSFAARDAVTGEWEPDTFRVPGYPLYIAGFYALFGIDEQAHLAIAVSQILLASLMCLAVAHLGTRYFSPPVGLFAAVLLAVDPWLSYAALSVLTETLFACVVLASFVVVAAALRRRTWQWAVWCGAVLALCTYVKPVAQHQIVLLGIAFLLLPAGWRQKARWVLLSFVIFGLMVGGWRLRNRLQTGHWDLVVHQGRALLWETTHLTRRSTADDYAQDARLAAARDIVATASEETAEAMAREPEKGPQHEGQIAFMRLRRDLGLSDRDADRLMSRIALENLLRHPLAFARRAAGNGFVFLTDTSMPVALAWDLGLVRVGVAESLQRGELLYPALNGLLRLATAALFVPLLLIGVARAWSELPRARPLTVYFVLTLLYYLLVATLVAAHDRYRLPLHGMMWLYASMGLFWGAARLARWRDGLRGAGTSQ